MTNEQIEKAKNDYAQSIIDSFGRSGVPCGISDIRSMIADGFKAGATEALASQWKEVDADNPETLPKEKQTVLCRLDDGEFLSARFDRIDTFDLDGEEYNVAEWSVGNGFESYTLGDEITHWLPIPPLEGGSDTFDETDK